MSKLDEVVKEQQETAAAEELAVLFPDVEVAVGDPDTGEPVTLTVCEFRFREGLEAQVLARPLIAALAALVDADADLPEATALDAAAGEHADIWLGLTARACGREAGWLERLADQDARALQNAMWEANGLFFIRRVGQAVVARQQTRSLLRSLASSTSSSEPGTAGDTASSASA